MKKLLFMAIAALALWQPARADEGMWLLPFMEKLNIKDMQAKGLKLSAEQIYSINQSSLKDAIVIFGGGCTGEIVSDQGLLLTNHHCGYGAIQAHSSLEHDYLKNGFWAKDKSQEIPSPTITATFIRQISDVTEQVLATVNDKMSEQERKQAISAAITAITQKSSKPEQNLTASIVPMFGGNQYLMFLSERFGDVRMVGAPPSSIGKFGGETDNWMWPRHTGDFSMFRVYASKSNKSTAAYDKENKPYKPLQHLKVSVGGYKEGDYAMIMGFPGRTNRYMTTWEIDQLLELDNPIRIFVRGEKQKLMWEDMVASDKVRIQYAGKYAGSSNYWKNSIGKSRGLKKLNVRGQKESEQQIFTAWVKESPARQAKYGQALTMIEKAVAERRPIIGELLYITECLYSIESLPLAGTVDAIMRQRIAPQMQQEKLKEAGANFFKDYNLPTDRKIAPRMLEIFAKDSGSKLTDKLEGVSTQEFADMLFAKSIFVDEAKYNAFVANPSLDVLDNDPAIQAYRIISARLRELDAARVASTELFGQGHRQYLAGVLEMNQGKKSLYPDANFTIRMTYGSILPYWAADAVYYKHYTTLGGVIAKEDNSNPEFVVHPRLKELWMARNLGPYSSDGDVPVAFLSNNDITGGNSGSPVLNGRGELIGIAFDGNWEAMSGDIAFEPNVQRSINVDIRYVLFVIDKFAGAKHLVDEMTIVK